MADPGDKRTSAPHFSLPDLEPPASASLTDAQIPFRGRPSHKHATWAKTFHSLPEVYITPQSVEEVQKAVILARQCRRRLVTVGSGHSPSDLTCTSAWMLDLRNLDKIQDVHMSDDGEGGRILAQAGISLHNINHRMGPKGLIMPNLGSIDVQSIAGAISTGTHGSSMSHGILAQSVRGLRIVLADGRAVWCSADKQADLFRAALVSLGAIGVIIDVEFQMVTSRDIEWFQDFLPMDQILANWDKGHWTQSEFVRCWWFPYFERMIVWKADKTTKPRRKAKTNLTGGIAGFHTYRFLLWLAGYVPRLLPWVEWFIFGMQYRFTSGHVCSAVEKQEEGLLMDCLFSQFVNEWAIPLRKGPEAINRFQKWLSGDERNARIPFSSKGLYVHSPIEVRVTDGSRNKDTPRAYLDPTFPDEPTLFLNATLYRPFGQDPPCRERYYEAFEWLMKQMGGRPHWAKNFSTVSQQDLHGMYGDEMQSYLKVRREVDPEGQFVGDWHRRHILPSSEPPMWLEERQIGTEPNVKEGGLKWYGEQAGSLATSPGQKSPILGFGFKRGSQETLESFDMMSGGSMTSGEEVDLPSGIGTPAHE